MSAPRAADRSGPPWYLRPKIALPAVGVLIFIMAVTVRQRTVGRSGDPRLTTYSAAPMGGRMFYEMSDRFGWQVERRTTPDFPAETNAITAVLDPPVPLRGPDVHVLLEHVRAGGGLLVMLGDGSALLADSLRLGVAATRLRVRERPTAADSCPPEERGILNTGRLLYTLWPGDRITLNTIAPRGPPPDSSIFFVAMDTAKDTDHGHPRHAAIGFPFGRGRIVAGADPDLLRNDAMRTCAYGLDIAAMRMLEYLGDRGRRGRVVFDEYHQGYGQQRGTMSTVAAYLVGTPSGRVLFQLLAAGLILLLAAAPRLIPPRDMERVERRSPLEHVDALGRAYAQVGATRSVTARLVRGVRRRVAGGAVRDGSAGPDTDASDDAFLDRARRDVPALADDVMLIRKALHAGVSRREFASVGAALQKLELSLTRI